MVQPLWKTIGRILKKSDAELPYNPAIPHLAYTQKNRKQGPKHQCLQQNDSQ